MSTNKSSVSGILFCLALLAFSLPVIASNYVRHQFTFDVARESPDIELLDYKYGDGLTHGTSTQANSYNGKVIPKAATTGYMDFGDLYVKWRVKSTNNVYEQTVKLPDLVQQDISDHKIYFILAEEKLHIYLISPESKKVDPNPCPPTKELIILRKSLNPDDKIFSKYCYLIIKKIHP